MIEIVAEEPHPRGKLYTVRAQGKDCRILITFHSIERIGRWGLSLGEVLRALISPSEVVIGHHGRFIAHLPLNRHMIRVVYEYEGDVPVVINVYKPRKERYYKGGGRYEDRVLGRC